MNRAPAALAKFVQVTHNQRRRAAEFLRSRGFNTFAREEHKVRALALLLREAGCFSGTFTVSALLGLQPLVLHSIAQSLSLLASEGLLIELAPRKYALSRQAPLAANYYASRSARFAQLVDDAPASKARVRPTLFRVLRVWKDLADRWFVTFAPQGTSGPGDAVPRDEAFRSYVKLQREIAS